MLSDSTWSSLKDENFFCVLGLGGGSKCKKRDRGQQDDDIILQ